ncbi:MAG TPA: BamA/TamA family outer membrane protein [Gemmatimonadales bacterium]|nr:BamA/TamA family outer membrane protein [Gemmatimonadales bacterium]
MRGLCGLALLLAPFLLAAQTKDNPRANWTDHLYPLAWYSSIDGFWFAGHYDWSSPIGFADRPEPTYARIALDAGVSTEGSYSVIADAQAPAYWEGWRFGLSLYGIRSNRLGYYGQGNNTSFDNDSTIGRSYFYQVSRTTRGARATIQRRITGPLRVMIGGSLDHTDFRELPGASLFQRDVANGTIPSNEVPFNDAVFRAGIVFDSRDLELDPHRGIFAEALYATGTGYTRTTGSLRAYVHPLNRLILAGRIGAEGMSGSPPIAAQFTFESSERPFNAMGGYRSLRGYHDGRYLGPGKLLGGVEARYGVLWSPRVLELKLLGFYDVGRVFAPGESVRLTTEGLHSAWGGGVGLAMLRNSVFTFVMGKGAEGTEVMFAGSWSY